MKIAVEGCAHGELDAIYDEVARLEKQNGYHVDLLLICGDFQAVRNERDMQCMAVPDKYKEMRDFYKYYMGEKKAPVLTIVIGGNHEASNHLWELYHGGWLAPNIYFLGHAGCVQVNGVRIAGASGIFKQPDFGKGHYERLPYDNCGMRSIYHIREYNVRKLSLLSSPTVFMSHDWPVGVTDPRARFGNTGLLVKTKPFFRKEVETGQLGSPPLWDLFRTIKPEWWFSAHLHVRWEATVKHGQLPSGGHAGGGGGGGVNPDEIVIDDEEPVEKAPKNPDEITIDDDEFDESSTQAAPQPEPQPEPSPTSMRTPNTSNPDEIKLDEEEEVLLPAPAPPPEKAERKSKKVTRFLALDKCLPGRKFLEVVDIPTPNSLPTPFGPRPPPKLTYDPEWLAITRAFHPYLSLDRYQARYPSEAEVRESVRKALDWVKEHVLGGEEGREKEIEEVQVFERVAPGPERKPGKAERNARNGKEWIPQPPFYPSPQTTAFCNMLDIEDKVKASMAEPSGANTGTGLSGVESGAANVNTGPNDAGPKSTDSEMS